MKHLKPTLMFASGWILLLLVAVAAKAPYTTSATWTAEVQIEHAGRRVDARVEVQGTLEDLLNVLDSTLPYQPHVPVVPVMRIPTHGDAKPPKLEDNPLNPI